MACADCKQNGLQTKEAMIARVDAIIDRVGRSRRVIIPLLQALQAEFSYLPSDALQRVYERTEIDRAQMISVSTFYAQFRHIPYGRHIIKVCTGTACHVKGANNVYDAFRRELNMDEETITTADQQYSIEKIACLGCCALAPVVQIDEKIFGHVQPGRVKEVLDEFQQYAQEQEAQAADEAKEPPIGEVRLGMENCCQASGTAAIYQAVLDASHELGIKVAIKPVSCVGACNQVPLIDVALPDGSIERYPNVKPEEIKEILLHHFKPASRLRRWKNALLNQVDMFHTDTTWDNILWKSEQERTGTINTFLSRQKRISTEGYGLISPLDIDEYMAHEGFAALEKAVTTMPRQAVIDTILQSGLRGRGGGGFPTGRKWSLVAATDKAEKYVICNGDEGDPGAFMDRILLESYPLRVIEGMIIAGYAVGARKGIFYIRAEYPQAVIRTRKAIELCREKGLLGENLFGSDFSFDITIFEGAGAFVCGEETALIASIEGQRGFPRQRPPYPAVEGLFGCPTLINNVETLSQISYIIRHGAEAYRTIGTEKSPGTKVFALAGKVCHGGLIEVPMGTTLNQIIEDIGGGVEGGEKLKAVQTGGPSGGCIPAELCDAPVDFDALTRMGAIMGSGGMVVLSESSCMVDVARYFLSFTCQESCGKCTFCRVGIRRMLDILDRLCTGKGSMEDIDKLEELAISIKQMALCGLGKTAPNPVLSTLKYFREEYEEHVKGICRTGTCKEMVKLEITEECVGCTKCAKACPSDAIPYTPYARHQIEVEKCVLCGLCIDECSYNAIRKVALKS
ncbi:MAG: NAD(P)H-dependent oxidoreductase subunit E [Parabacteroides sp.]|nr:NAD(P)H-dependent oxidoreductase subunit E [Parabacteroides sp.]MDY4758372.1 NAD(P)H-dependent oxidoreductase subunit E [Parabacteroides sp.]